MQVYFKDAYCPCFTSAHQRHWATQHHCGNAHELLSWRSLGMLKARSMVRQTDEASHYMIQSFGRATLLWIHLRIYKCLCLSSNTFSCFQPMEQPDEQLQNMALRRLTDVELKGITVKSQYNYDTWAGDLPFNYSSTGARHLTAYGEALKREAKVVRVSQEYSSLKEGTTIQWEGRCFEPWPSRKRFCDRVMYRTFKSRTTPWCELRKMNFIPLPCRVGCTALRPCLCVPSPLCFDP